MLNAIVFVVAMVAAFLSGKLLTEESLSTDCNTKQTISINKQDFTCTNRGSIK